MSDLPREENLALGTLRAVGALGSLGGSLGVIVSVLAGNGGSALGVLVGAGVLIGAVSAIIIVPLSGQRQASRPIPSQAPRSLRWLRFLLPYVEGRAWLAEAAGVIAEAPDEDTRRHYLRCYRRAIPRLIFTIWSEHLRELHNRNRGCEVTAKRTKPANRNNPAGPQPIDAPWWRLVFLLVDGDDDQWRRWFLLIVLAGLFLVGGLAVLL
ncbi:MAG: hypothetical protein ACRDR6_25445, partial [Pseudonocardiaceae bacterium]